MLTQLSIRLLASPAPSLPFLLSPLPSFAVVFGFSLEVYCCLFAVGFFWGGGGGGEFHNAAQVDLELKILLLLPPKS